MKKIIMGLVCLSIASCKISEIDYVTPPNTPDKGKLVYQEKFNIENLEHVALITNSSENSYDLDISSQTLTLKKPNCENTITISNTETNIILNTLKQIRICDFETKYPATDCASILPESNNYLHYYYRGAIDPDHLPANIPGWCNSRGLCSNYDVTIALAVFDIYKDLLACP